ncbi:hydroxyisourate hydrolase [Streptomyces sp. ME19-03-3]|nr:hydroxyisourate hydrolase [Streptomyces sp. ME19-03-3]
MTSVSTHVLDTSRGCPAQGVPVTLAVRAGSGAPWVPHGTSRTDADGRCKDLPDPPDGTTHVRLEFATERYLTGRDTGPRARAEDRPDTAGAGGGGAFFPEVATVFAVEPGRHYHVPLLLNPFGYSVYRGS